MPTPQQEIARVMTHEAEVTVDPGFTIRVSGDHLNISAAAVLSVTPAQLAAIRDVLTPASHADDTPVCVFCHEQVGVVHYSAGDRRWQPSPALGDDFCEARWYGSPLAIPVTRRPDDDEDETKARESGLYRHEVES